jgi:hypothetical protein
VLRPVFEASSDDWARISSPPRQPLGATSRSLLAFQVVVLHVRRISIEGEVGIVQNSLIATKHTPHTPKELTMKTTTIKTVFNTNTLLDKVTGTTLVAIAVATLIALFGGSSFATAQEPSVAEIVKLDAVVVTAPRTQTVKLDTIVVTAQR